MKSFKNYLLFALVFILTGTSTAFAQIGRDDRATIVNFKGIQYKTPDSTFYVNFRFRMQNRLKYTSMAGDDFDVKDFEARVRRLRLRMDGFIYNSKLTYSIQLAFSKGDLDMDDTGYANIVRDAVIFYNFTDNFFISFGINKLPGNRQRVNSSGALQFADRSQVNASFNIDRDFGIKAHYESKLGNVPINLAAAITTGEGRVSDKTDGGLAYTGRAEILPLGEFKNGGDYSEGDLEREETPKLSIGGGFSYNEGAIRTRGQTGKFMPTSRNLETTFIDGIFKYAGWAYQAEYMKLHTENPIQCDDENDPIYNYKEYGINQQLSYLLNDDEGYEIAARYSMLNPHSDIKEYEKDKDILELGLTKYFRAHRLKLQLNAAYQVNDNNFNFNAPGNHWIGTFQIEFGI